MIDRSADAKVSPAFSFTCTCTIPGSRYSIGSSTVTMFTPRSLSRRSAAYSVVVLPEPVGPVTRISPSRDCSSRSIALQLVGVKAHAVERGHRRPPVEHANDDFLTVRRRQRRDAKVDRDAVHRDARAAVLRTQPIGDVEPGEDLDARHERRPDGTRQRSRERQHAVHAMPNGDALLFRLDVNVARPPGDAAGQQLVDELRDRSARRPRPAAAARPRGRCRGAGPRAATRARGSHAFRPIDLARCARRSPRRRRARAARAARSRSRAFARSRRRADRRSRSRALLRRRRAERRESVAPTFRAPDRRPARGLRQVGDRKAESARERVEVGAVGGRGNARRGEFTRARCQRSAADIHH